MNLIILSIILSIERSFISYKKDSNNNMIANLTSANLNI